MRGVVASISLAGLLAACATTPAGLPPVSVTAVAETEPVGTAAQDAADDPAIWRNSADPAASLIVATDKKAGLHVYGLDGTSRSFADGGLLNNVDLVTMADGRVIVIASDRNDLAAAQLQVYELDTQEARLSLIGKAPGGAGEGYGLCLGREQNGVVLAYSVLKHGAVHEVAITIGSGLEAQMLRQFSVPSQAEGCVADPRDGTLYVGEELGGIWRFKAGSTAGELVAPVDNRHLVADVEGLALVTEGDGGGYLVASSQGDNAYAVFQLPGMEPRGRFRIAAGRLGGAEETDGIELAAGSFGPDYPDGLFVAQDGHNAPEAQNFKLVSWAAIRAALGL